MQTTCKLDVSQQLSVARRALCASTNVSECLLVTLAELWDTS